MKSDQGGCARRGIFVLGMHRSGTSAVTRALGLSGATMPLNTVPAGFDNETGFWEPLEIVRLHDEILASAGSCWDDAAAFPAEWFASDVAASFRTRLADALARDFPDAPALFALKDPRLCRLVPLWLTVFEALGIEPLVVIPVRNPLEIAASLRKRNSLPEEYCLLLWLRHFLAAEATTRHCRRSVVRYDYLLRDWRGAIDKIGRDLGVEWPRQSPTADAEITQFISLALRHHHFADTDVYTQKNVAEWVKSAFSWALRAADSQPPDFTVLDEISAELNVADVAFMPLVADGRSSVLQLNKDIELLEKLRVRADDELQQLQVRRMAEVQQLRDQLQSNEEALRLSRSEVAAGVRVIEELRDDVSALRDEVRSARDEARSARDQTLREVNQSRAAQSAAEVCINGLRSAYDQSQSELSMVRYQYDKVVSSTTWRALGPFRRAAGAVPSPIRRQARRAMKLLYWIATPQKLGERLRFLRARHARPDAGGGD